MLMLVLALLGILGTLALARERPSANVMPGAKATNDMPLGSIDSSAASGYSLQVMELTWEPGNHTVRIMLQKGQSEK